MFLLQLPHENKAMNFPLYFLLILLIVSHHFSYSSLAMRMLQDDGVDQIIRDSSKEVQEELSFVGGNDDHDQVQRKDLHEVHSGPNPIGNSIPQQKWIKNKLRNL